MDYFFQIWLQDKYFFEIIYFGASTFNPNCSPVANLMPSPSASSKFVLSVLKFSGILKIFRYTQNIFCVLKWANLCKEI